MKIFRLIPILFLILTHTNQNEMRINYWNETDENNQLRPLLEKQIFDSLSGFDFGWYILEPIDLESEDNAIIELTKRFSPIQKTIYFFWFLDAQVTNGGFDQFYWNGYDLYLPAIVEGLKVIKDNDLLVLIEEVDKFYLENLNVFNKYREKNDFGEIEIVLPEFKEYSQRYYEINENSMKLIETFAKENPAEVGKFK